MPLRGSTQRSICGHLRPTTIPKRARSTSTRVETGQASLKLPKSQLHKPQLDYHVLLADPARTTKNHIDRRTPLTLGSQHVPRMQVLREAQLSLQREIASVKSKQKEIEEKMKHDPDFRAHGRTQAQRIKAEALTHETELNTTEAELLDLGLALPNFSDPVSPVGPEDSAIEIARYGPSPISSDPKRDHLDLCAHWGLLDPSASAITSGTSFPFLKSTLALLEQSLINYALSIAISHGYTPVIPPDVVRSDLAWRCGFQPRDPEAAAATQTYTIHTPPASPELCLAGTAEVPLSGLFADRMFRGEEMPMKVVGVGRAFRAEAGARGKDTRGLYRVHQFTKVELFTVCEPGDSEACFKSMGEVQKQVAEGLDIPLRVLEMPTSELGASASRKWDMEAWMPGRGKWGEITSLSNCTDYQSRRLHIRHRPSHNLSALIESPADAQKATFSHTLNGTAAAIPRLLIALMENGVRFDAEGKPEALDLPKCLERYWIGGNTVGEGKDTGIIRWV